MAEEDEVNALFVDAFKKALECPRKKEVREIMERVFSSAAILLEIKLTLKPEAERKENAKSD